MTFPTFKALHLIFYARQYNYQLNPNDHDFNAENFRFSKAIYYSALEIRRFKTHFSLNIFINRAISMLILSEVLIQNHQLESYTDLIQLIQKKALEGEMFFDIDIKPPYPDTPDEWESDLEAKFTSPSR